MLRLCARPCALRCTFSSGQQVRCFSGRKLGGSSPHPFLQRFEDIKVSDERPNHTSAATIPCLVPDSLGHLLVQLWFNT